MKRLLLLFLCSPVLFLIMLRAQSPAPQPSHDDMPPGMKMDSADSSMSMHEMHHSGHMHMTALRPVQPGDQKRADDIAATAKEVMAKYADYKVAEADGFKPFFPNFKQPMYHFSNRQYAIEAERHFNPEHPTSLLYEKAGDGYRLIGVMYTAPYRFTEDELNERVPLSIAQWHFHSNLCVAPMSQWRASLKPHPQFGLNGSITTEDACKAAGGTFHDHVLNWMVHVYPNESDPSKVWSAERGMGDMH